MKQDYLRELRDREAMERMKEAKEKENNPLIEYSTTQLKEELRRRKKERG